ncbi:MAG: GAF domain-containing protein [Planctomycetes bacterium]|nr:GAF domain-containing protein [Planctomycetota bacterium]
MSVRLDSLTDCMQGIVPSVIATCSRHGEPNVTYLSHIYYLDEQHVALSCQFFNKTRQNIDENPLATIVMYEPVTMAAWRMRVEYLRSETEGPLFDRMSARIQVIASHTGMAGVFRLISADVFRVLAIEPVHGFLMPADPLLDAEPTPVAATGPLSELRGLQLVSERITRATTRDGLLADVLASLDEVFGFSHAMVFLRGDDADRLELVAAGGYDRHPEVPPVAIGTGLVGTVAERGSMIRINGVAEERRYGEAIRRRVRQHHGGAAPELAAAPGLADAQVQIGLPLIVGDNVLGVLMMESADPLRFDEWDEVYLQILANQIAAGIERTGERRDAPAAAAADGPRFTFFPHDDCGVVDGEYLVRNLPGRILWKLLCTWRDSGRTEFTNRELRLDRSLELPPIKDNLESRLILLRKRLEERCPGVRLVSTGRGRFALAFDREPIVCDEQPA